MTTWTGRLLVAGLATLTLTACSGSDVPAGPGAARVDVDTPELQKLKSETAIEVAKKTLEELVEQLARQPGLHTLTVVKSSDPHQPELLSARIDSSGESISSEPSL